MKGNITFLQEDYRNEKEWEIEDQDSLRQNKRRNMYFRPRKRERIRRKKSFDSNHLPDCHLFSFFFLLFSLLDVSCLRCMKRYPSCLLRNRYKKSVISVVTLHLHLLFMHNSCCLLLEKRIESWARNTDLSWFIPFTCLPQVVDHDKEWEENDEADNDKDKEEDPSRQSLRVILQSRRGIRIWFLHGSP